jgi:hypothetical protein
VEHTHVERSFLDVLQSVYELVGFNSQSFEPPIVRYWSSAILAPAKTDLGCGASCTLVTGMWLTGTISRSADVNLERLPQFSNDIRLSSR